MFLEWLIGFYTTGASGDRNSSSSSVAEPCQESFLADPPLCFSGSWAAGL